MNVASNKDCYGCGVCASICSKKAICISHNSDGFYEPVVNASICNNCGLCVKVCSFANTEISKVSPLSQFAAWSKNDDNRRRSTSGGVCYELSKYLIGQEYKAILATYNPISERVEHQIIQKHSDLVNAQGSRYLQSFTKDALSHIERGKQYLFIGTPCQVASLRKLIQLRKIEDSFLLVDFFCHGVPSYLLWQKYLNAIKSEGISIKDVQWRDKKNGWSSSYRLKIKSDTEVSAKLQKVFPIFYKLFIGDACLGKACYDNCKFKGTSSCADIRVGDFWGAKYSGNVEGVSCVLCITEKGDALINKLDIVKEPQNLKDCLDGQMESCATRSKNFKAVMKILHSKRSTIFDISRFLYLQELKMRVLRLIKNPSVILKKF